LLQFFNQQKKFRKINLSQCESIGFFSAI